MFQDLTWIGFSGHCSRVRVLEDQLFSGAFGLIVSNALLLPGIPVPASVHSPNLLWESNCIAYKWQ